MPVIERAETLTARALRRALPVELELADEQATAELGRVLAAELEAGDLLTLSGAIGAGKTTLARSILRARLADPELEAPSPTFTLLQTYEGGAFPLVHLDLYRIGGGGELVELGFDELRATAAVILEWPERAEEELGAERLDVKLDIAGTGGRRAVISGKGPLAERVGRAYALIRMVEAAGWSGASRSLMQGDASSRAYERLAKSGGESAILMIAPPRPDGPPVRRGKPYSAIAKLAESVHAFAAMDRGLVDQGFSAPRILGENLDVGLLLLEDFGSAPVVDENGPIPERYAEATRLLARLHSRSLPASLPFGDNGVHHLPAYDLDALLIEVELLLDWYLPHVVGTRPSGSVRAEFGHVWRDTLGPVLAGPQTWTLRDYHSPNLIWLPDRDGVRRVGLLDFQDAVLGAPAYDVVSLLQDARVNVPAELELTLLGVYAAERRAADPSFDMAAFATSYAILGAQRATKILGIFARLDQRDGKPQYLAHLPRIRAYLARNLAHQTLRRLQAWFQYHGGDLQAGMADAAPPAQDTGLAPASTTAMVLAAGLGQRMRPVTDTRPKPLVSVGGRALIDHALTRLAEAGIRRAIVNVHYLPDMIEAHLAQAGEIAITISDERDALLETGGGVKRALPLLGPEFVVMNSDSLWTERGEPNLSRLLAEWRPEVTDILLLLAARDSLGYDGRGDYDLLADGTLRRRAPDGTAPFVYAGAAILKADLFADTPDGAFSLNLLFDRAQAAGRLRGIVLDGEWLHVGTPDAIRQAEERLAAA